jgi:hypothetical protein
MLLLMSASKVYPLRCFCACVSLPKTTVVSRRVLIDTSFGAGAPAVVAAAAAAAYERGWAVEEIFERSVFGAR